MQRCAPKSKVANGRIGRIYEQIRAGVSAAALLTIINPKLAQLLRYGYRFVTTTSRRVCRQPAVAYFFLGGRAYVSS